MEMQAHSAEWIDAEAHFAFDWNGWGIGVEPDGPHEILPPGRMVEAWQLDVRAIVDHC